MKSALIISAKYNKRKVSKRRGQLEQDVDCGAPSLQQDEDVHKSYWL